MSPFKAISDYLKHRSIRDQLDRIERKIDALNTSDTLVAQIRKVTQELRISNQNLLRAVAENKPKDKE